MRITLSTARLCGLIAFLATAGHGLVAAAGPVSIQVSTERTARRSNDPVRSNRPHLEIAEIRYVITVRAGAGAPETATAEWSILVGGSTSGSSRHREGAHGSQPLNFGKNKRQVVIRTEPLTTTAGAWSPSSRDSPSIEASIYGYGIRVTDAQGRVLAEKYSPSRAEQDIKWTAPAVEASSSPAPDPAPHPTVPMPVVF